MKGRHQTGLSLGASAALAVLAVLLFVLGQQLLALFVIVVSTLVAAFSAVLLLRRAAHRQSTDARNTQRRIEAASSQLSGEIETLAGDVRASTDRKLDDIRSLVQVTQLQVAVGNGRRSGAALTTRPVPALLQGVVLDRDQPIETYLPLDTTPRVFSLDVSGTTELSIELTFVVSAHVAGTKSGVLTIEALDAQRSSVDLDAGYLQSDTLGAFRYLDVKDNSTQSIVLRIPARTSTVRIGLRGWRAAGELHVKNAVAFRKTTWRPNEVRARASSQGPRRKLALPAVPVASITDEFTYNSLRNELSLSALTPTNWREEFERVQPQAFFCESAWSGTDPVARPWKGKVYASTNFPHENRATLLAILDHCHRSGIPTVFWNKEDPSHYEDRMHDFPATARHFDHVFTTDESCVDRYASDYGLQSVHALPFATQPRLYHPVVGSPRTDDVVFAGSWYSNHEERSAVMETVLDRIIAADRELVIYDRYYDDLDPLHIFPERFQRFTRPAVRHADLAGIYRRTRFGLNFNTVTNSPTMFARRVFELMSSHTLVLSNWSLGTENLFGRAVIHLDRDVDRFSSMTDAEIDELRDANLHNVLSKHTYRHRMEHMARIVGIDFDDRSTELTLLDVVEGEAELVEAVQRRRRLGSVVSHHVIALSEQVSATEASRLQTEHGRLGTVIVHLPFLQDFGVDMESVIPSAWILHAPLTVHMDRSAVASAAVHTEYATGPLRIGPSAAPRYAWRLLDGPTLIPRTDLRETLAARGRPQLLLTLEARR